jgi:hypothetical protein
LVVALLLLRQAEAYELKELHGANPQLSLPSGVAGADMIATIDERNQESAGKGLKDGVLMFGLESGW